jgi:hypothetical protein
MLEEKEGETLDKLVDWLVDYSATLKRLVTFEEIKNKGKSFGVPEKHIEVLWYEYLKKDFSGEDSK